MIKFLDIQKVTHSFQPELDAAINRVVSSGWYLHGKETEAFEDEFAQYICSHWHQHADSQPLVDSQPLHCVSVANGLDALYLVLSAMKTLDEKWSDGDEVIVPAFTFVATAEAVVRAGLRPVLVDVGEDALIDSRQLDAALSPRTRAIIPVHLYGQTAATKIIRQWADAHGVFVLEDAAQAHGAADVGLYGHAAAFSFYPGKNLGALGDGGALVTRDGTLAARARAIANYGAERKYYHEYEGCNSRLDELQAAVLRVKLRRLDADNFRRQDIACRYHEHLTNAAVSLLPCPPAASVWHIYPVFSDHRETFMRHLKAQGVESLIHYPLALHQQPCLKDCHRAATPLHLAATLAAREISLPISPIMTDEEVERVITAVQNLPTFL